MPLHRSIALALLLLPSALAGQHSDHSAHGPGVTLPQEPGQGAFAAISEIVEILAKDRATDWTRVDISALRAHLLDMDRLITETEVTQSSQHGAVVFHITLPDRDSAALRMVPAHAPVLASETGRTSTVEDQGDALIWTVTAPATDLPKLHALGFFGLMATGNHHRAHHLALARGEQLH